MNKVSKKEERKVRFKVALEILQRLHSDMCRAERDDVSNEEVEGLLDILHQMIRYAAFLGIYPSESATDTQ